MQPASTVITEVLSGIDGYYDLVYAYDATGAHASSGNWQLYDSKQFIGSHTLLTLDEKRGFWINVTSTVPISLAVEGAVPYTITVADGVVPVATTIDLSTSAGGWNLVGYPSQVNRDLPDVLTDHGVGEDFSLVYAYHADVPDPLQRWTRFDRTAEPWSNSMEQLTPGWGYWILASADNTWSVDYFAP